ncbi:HAD family acid phosphatase [Streptomyces huasconensis]|uniref:HAD family acid phosphatase n=1 Tax=Streptomyces huasconensis TaxID=1854574 RepID=UPI0033C46804
MTNRKLGRVGVVAAVLTVTTGLSGVASASATAAPQVAPAAAASVDYNVWAQDTKAAVDKGTAYVKERAAKAKVEKQAIVLDIDNTSLETHFHPLPPTPAVKPVLDLVKYADAQGVDVFFVTARPGLINPVTKYNLKEVGYPVDGLYERGFGDLFGSVGEYKAAKRAEIEAKGYKIIANVGNNDHDFAGGHAESSIKLPDYDGQLS